MAANPKKKAPLNADALREARMETLLAEMLRAKTTAEAREKFREFAALHAQRPKEFVVGMEAKKGLR